MIIFTAVDTSAVGIIEDGKVIVNHRGQRHTYPLDGINEIRYGRHPNHLALVIALVLVGFLIFLFMQFANPAVDGKLVGASLVGTLALVIANIVWSSRGISYLKVSIQHDPKPVEFRIRYKHRGALSELVRQARLEMQKLDSDGFTYQAE